MTNFYPFKILFVCFLIIQVGNWYNHEFWTPLRSLHNSPLFDLDFKGKSTAELRSVEHYFDARGLSQRCKNLYFVRKFLKMIFPIHIWIMKSNSMKCVIQFQTWIIGQKMNVWYSVQSSAAFYKRRIFDWKLEEEFCIIMHIQTW